MKRISSWLEITEKNWRQVLRRTRRELAYLRDSLSDYPKKNAVRTAIEDFFGLFDRFQRIISVIEEDHRKETDRLKGRIKSLEGRLKLDPGNSHKPPSTSRNKKIKNSREKTGRKPGAQPGRKGAEMPLDVPDRVTKYDPTRCNNCGRNLEDVPEAEVVKHQVVDLKNGQSFVHEHQRVTKFCPECGDMNRGDLPDEIRLPRSRRLFGPNLKAVAVYFLSYQLIPVARTREIIVDLFGVNLSQGSLVNFIRDLGERLWDWEIETKADLLSSAVMHADESGVRCEKRNDWVHVHSTKDITLLSHHRNRGREAHDEIGLLPEYKGHLVHDGFKAYDKYECEHSVCNAHILRELKYLHEEEKSMWALAMANFLKQSLHTSRLKLLNKNKTQSEYRKLLRDGFEECNFSNEFKGRPPDYYKHTYESGKRIKVGKYRRRKLTRAQNLLIRLRDDQNEVLAFAFDSSIPFTNNQAERDLRMIRLKEKISGCFRSEESAKLFCRVRSFMQTMKKQDFPLLDNLVLVQVLEL